MSLNTTFDQTSFNIRPGQPQMISAQNRMKYNDLMRYFSLRPHILPEVVKLIRPRWASITGLLMQMKGGTNLSELSAANDDKGRLGKNFTKINAREFAWAVEAPKGWVYKILEAPIANAQGIVGANGTTFSIVVDKNHGSVDDVIQTVGSRHNLKIVDFVALGEFSRKLVLRAMNNVGVELKFLRKNQELSQPLFNQKQELSSTGSSPYFQFNDMRRNSMTTLRHEYSASGWAANRGLYDAKGNPTDAYKSDARIFMVQQEDGEVKPYWLSMVHIRAMEQHLNYIDQLLFWGQKDLDANGNYRRDSQGNEFLTGDGIYYQTNNRMKREYRNAVQMADLDAIMENMLYDRDGLPADCYVFADAKMRKDIDQLLRRAFSANPQIYFSGDGRTNYYSSKDASKQGFLSNFTRYETTYGALTVVPSHYFDSRSTPNGYDNYGNNMKRGRGFFFNMAGIAEGDSPIKFLMDRFCQVGVLRGMANPSASGDIATAVDGTSTHIISDVGVAVGRDNIFAELIQRY